MDPPNQRLEWHFITEDHEGQSLWYSLPNKDRHRETHESKQTSRLYELIVAVAVFYGLAVYFIWQQAERRMTVLERELVALRSELSAHQGNEDVTAVGSVAPENRGSTHPYQFETEYLRFEANKRTADMVRSVALLSDARYQQLHRDWGVALPATNDKLKIIIDPSVNLDYPFTDGEALVVAFPKNAAERYGLTPVEVLTNEIFDKLTRHTLVKALEGRDIKLQWRTMTYALQFYLQLAHGHHRDWQLDPLFLARRHAAQTRALAHALQAPGAPMAREVADPFVEYMLEIYGYTTVPLLLDAFGEHESWETLAPAVFGISAGELEENWHTYLKQEYPRAKE